MSESAKRWDAVLHIVEVKEPKLFAYLSRGRFREESRLNVTLVAPSEADAEEVRKGVRVYEAVIELCTTTVYGEKRGLKVTVSETEFAEAPPMGGLIAPPAPAASVLVVPPPPALAPLPPAPLDPKAKMEADTRAAVESEFKGRIEEEVKKRMDAKLKEDTAKEEARLRAIEAEKGRRLSVIQRAEEKSANLARKLFEMKNVAHPEQAWKLRPLLAEATLILGEIGKELPLIDRRDDAVKEPALG